MGRRRAEALRTTPGARFLGITDLDPERTRHAATTHGGRAYRDLEELLEDPAVELVLVCTPNRDHAAIALRALELGRHVFVEKPLAISSAEGERMVAAAEAHRRSLAVGANTRWIPAVREAIEAVDAGRLGRPLMFRGWIGHDGARFGGPWFTNRALAGGGTLLDNGVHLLDLARRTLGEFTGCTARTARLAHRQWDVEDFASATYDTASGGVASIVSSWIDRSGYLYFEIHGETDYLTVDLDGGLRIGSEGARPVPPGPPGESYRQELAQLLGAIRSGADPAPSGRDGAAILRAVEAAYRSSDGRRYEELR